jgi:hypothetical protein
VLLWAMKIERKKDVSGRLVPLDVEGLVDGGLVVSVDRLFIIIKFRYWYVLC